MVKVDSAYVRRGAALVAAAALVVLGVGCSAADPAPVVSEEYSPPAWMAEKRARDEAVSAFEVACVEESGYTVTVIDRNTQEYHVPSGLSDEAREAYEQAMYAVADECTLAAFESVGGIQGTSDSDDYAQMLDTVECLRNNGYPDMPDAPSEQVWIESLTGTGGIDTWAPYEWVYSHNPTITQDEWVALKDICVEGGISYGVNFE